MYPWIKVRIVGDREYLMFIKDLVNSQKFYKEYSKAFMKKNDDSACIVSRDLIYGKTLLSVEKL